MRHERKMTGASARSMIELETLTTIAASIDGISTGETEDGCGDNAND